MIAQAGRAGGPRDGGADDLGDLLAFVSRHVGLVFPPGRLATAEGGVRRAMRRVGARDTATLLERARSDDETLDELLAELTVGETYFFREGRQFDFIRERVVPDLLAVSGPRPVRAWSAACASGEEAYSLAIALREGAGGSPCHVVGTDVSRHRLRTAQRGVYKDWSMRGVGPERIARHFVRQGKQYRLTDVDREGVDFRYLNLAEDVFPSIASAIWGMDVILCRNVLIYFDEETIRRVAARLLDSLSDDGWLFLGASDPVVSDFLPCDVELTGAGVAYRRKRERARGTVPAEGWTVSLPLGAAAPAPGVPLAAPAQPIAAAGQSTGTSAQQAVTSAQPTATSAHPTTAPAPPTAAALEAAYGARDYARAAELARGLTSTGDARPWILLVRSLANEGRLAEAGSACAAALERHGTSAELMYLHGVLLEQAGRHRECAEAARRALYLDRDLVVAQLLHGGALARVGDAKSAARVLASAERALAALDPRSEVRASDGEPAGRLREMARVQLKLLEAR